LIQPGDWVRVRAVAGSEASQQASQQYAGQLGRETEPPIGPGGDYTVMMDDGPQLRLPKAALTRVPINEYGDPL
jgi:hypothetical protein